ncbi:MAG TPA: hypothetical protein VN025_20190 [Candidatus Dormibacteraeota bacterium]|jgi:hypothetical protein|nr:hypothetical protein [Candidatus Dormibacteraeota bacterium]
MTKALYRVFRILLPALCVLGTPLLSQTTKTRSEFLIDVNRPFVYVKFDHIGPGAPRSEDEPTSRVWVRLTNNCLIPITVRANGVPDESPKDEVGVQYDVVENPKPQGAGTLFSPSSARTKSESDKSTDEKDQKGKEQVVPRGYMFHVASLIIIDPGEEILFSLPVNHLSRNWHIEIPFEFELPQGKGPRDPLNGGEPLMAVHYSLWDLPPKAQAELAKK